MTRLLTALALAGLLTLPACEQLEKLPDVPTVGAAEPTGPAGPGQPGPGQPGPGQPGPGQPGPGQPAGQGAAAQAPDQQPSGPSQETAVDQEFQGYHLKVWVDGTGTSRHKMVAGHGQVWMVGTITTSPKIRFTYDEGHMGPLKGTEVVINARKDGDAWDPTQFIKPAADTRSWKADADNATDKWQRFAGGLETLDVLPPGRYVLHFTVNGEKTWDRQSIYIEVE